MAQTYSPDGGTVDGFGHQHTRWPARQCDTNVMEQNGGSLFDSQLPNQAANNSASYPQQFATNEYTNNPWATAPGANSFGQQLSPDVRMNNPYSAISGTNGDMQMAGRYSFGSGSSPFTAQAQQHIFSEEQAGDPHQYAMTSDTVYGVQMGRPFPMNQGTNPFATRAQQTSSYDTQGGGYQQYTMASGGDRVAQLGNSSAIDPGANQSTQFGNYSPDAHMGGQYAVSSSDNSHFAQQPALYVETNNQDTIASGSNSFSSHNIPCSEGYSNNQSSASSEVPVKRELSDDDFIPGDAAIDDDVDDETSQQPDKKRKINKNGRVRKIREPRGHLRRWDESDVSRALMGIVWACGENGVVIPFAQAAKLVDQDCTSGALQQAILKMHDKMNADGAQLPKMKMNWPKKPSVGGKAIIRDNGKVPRKKPTLTQATQCNIVSLPARPRDTSSATSDAAQQYLVLPMGESRSGQSASAGVKHEPAHEMISPPQKISDLPPSMPVQSCRSPVCPPAPRHPVAPHPALVNSSMGAATLNQRLPSKDAPSSLPNFAQQRATGFTQQQSLNAPMNLQNKRLQQGHNNNAQLGPSATFNADFEQRNNPGGLAQRSSSSNMRLNTSMSHSAAPSIDFTMFHSPMSGSFQASGNPKDVSNFADMRSPFSMSESSYLLGPHSSLDDQSPGLGPAFDPSRRDSAFGSGAQSVSSSQGSNGPMKRSARESQQAFQASLEAAAAEPPMTSTPSQTMQAYLSLQQPRQQLSIGLDTLANPFGGTLGDAFGGPFSPIHQSDREMDDPFGPWSTADVGKKFDDI